MRTAKEAAATIIAILEELDLEDDRTAALSLVADIICPDCGWGSRKKPNPSCQCRNDE